MQIVFAVIVILVPGGREFFDAISRVFVKIIDFAMTGAVFVFGDLAKASEFGFIFAFQVLPTIIFFASLMGVLYPHRIDAENRPGHGLGDVESFAGQWL